MSNNNNLIDVIKPVYVTEPFLPPLEEFQEYLREIWENKWLTNNGQFHREFEQKLCEFLGVPYVSLFANGTLALITALQALRITGEVITTPFSFVATAHALHWNGIKPVFCDIEQAHCTIDPDKIEPLITPATSAILPVHVYGHPCNVDAIQDIADMYGLKVIYDAAHAFGVRVNGTSICNFGDLSVLSFHATKVLTTFEGGAIICHNEKMKKRIDYLKNFGIAGETTVVGPGINAKMNEFQAALGLLQLKYHENNRNKRQRNTNIYKEYLNGIDGIRYLDEMNNTYHNYAYFPIFVQDDYALTRDELYTKMKQNNIHLRRYFYPLISEFPTYRSLQSSVSADLKTAKEISEQVLCLPISPNIDVEDIEFIVSLLRSDVSNI